MGVSTVKLNGTTLMTVNDTTADASEVFSGQYFYTAAGNRTEGTIMHSIQTYSSVTELGLTSGSATVQATWAAMPDHSMLVASSSQFLSSERPVASSVTLDGCFEIIKDSGTNGYGSVIFRSMFEDYKMTVNITPTGTWTQIVNGITIDSCFQIKTTTCTAGSSVSGGSTFNFSTQITSVAGYTPQCIAGWQSSGMTYLTLSNLYVDHGDSPKTIHLSGRNLGSSSVTPSFTVVVLYIKNS